MILGKMMRLDINFSILIALFRGRVREILWKIETYMANRP
jgi:hypothetical protein